jgi:RNA polymerase subunit RPABC4/transcription elongation factor Spt4
MSRFREEVGLIPRTAWFIATVIYLAAGTLLFVFPVQQDPHLRAWPLAGKILFCYGMMLAIFLLVLLQGYVYGDAKRRGMRYVMWTLVAVLVPNALGIILYFILRDPRPITCLACHASVRAKFTFCPHCGGALAKTCPNCGDAVEAGWSHCPRCGRALEGTAAAPA